MRFTPGFIERVKELVTTSEVVSEVVSLKHTGREFSGLCPFHNEKSPSFTVNDDKKFYHCFGCGAHGDAIIFLTKTRGYSYIEAVKYLADKIGLEIPKLSKREEKQYDLIQDLYNLLERSADFFHKQLFLPKNSEALNYLKNRGITIDIINKFKIGYAPEGMVLSKYLKSEGFDFEQLKQAGLVNKVDNHDSYERFRARIIFPIQDKSNRIIAFGGRGMHNAKPKYLNSPETILFKKSEVLYLENFAREEAWRSREIYVVEGFIDAIIMHLHGFSTTVATLGTAITLSHLQNLWKLSPEPVICLDGDSAGKKAMRKIAELSLNYINPEHSLKFAVMPNGADPDEVLSKYGVSTMKGLISSASILSEFLWGAEYQDLAKAPNPEQISKFENQLNLIITQIKDKIVSANYKRYFQNKLWEDVKKLTKKSKELASNELQLSMSFSTDMVERAEYNLLSVILVYPELLNNHNVIDEFANIEFVNGRLDKLRTAILEKKDDNLEKKLITSLENLGFNHEISYLCGKDSTFASNLTKNEFIADKSNVIWDCTLAKYYYAVIDKERTKSLSEMTEEALTKAALLEAQMLVKENEIKKLEELLYDDEL